MDQICYVLDCILNDVFLLVDSLCVALIDMHSVARVLIQTRANLIIELLPSDDHLLSLLFDYRNFEDCKDDARSSVSSSANVVS